VRQVRSLTVEREDDDVVRLRRVTDRGVAGGDGDRRADRSRAHQDRGHQQPVAAGAAVVTLAYLIVTRRRVRHEIAIKEEREAALTQALHKIDVLSGLLAMCASCKRIRDDDHHWEPVEVFLERHGQISVSHGICPRCTTDLYPDYVDALSKPAA
jgi:hypothetical protein